MKPNVKRAAWLSVACLGLLSVSSLSAQEPKLRATLQGHDQLVVAVAFSPDSKTLASASYDGTLKLWDMTTGNPRSGRRHSLASTSLASGSDLSSGLTTRSPTMPLKQWHGGYHAHLLPGNG